MESGSKITHLNRENKLVWLPNENLVTVIVSACWLFFCGLLMMMYLFYISWLCIFISSFFAILLQFFVDLQIWCMQEEVAKDFGIPVQFQRFWLWAKRQNHTYRPNRPLTPMEETQSVNIFCFLMFLYVLRFVWYFCATGCDMTFLFI